MAMEPARDEVNATALGLRRFNAPPKQFVKGRLRIVGGVCPHQVHVVAISHLLIIGRSRGKLTIIFAAHAAGGALTLWRIDRRVIHKAGAVCKKFTGSCCR